jgi:OOP family OmpA-OmpF porin
MVRKSALIITVLSTALGAPALVGCVVHTGSAQPENPPPAAPPPATAASTPAPTATTTAPPAEQPKSTATVKGDTISIPGNIVFDTNKATLKAGAGSEQVLEQLKLFLDQNPQVTKLRVEGHTDNVGNDADNQTLSGQRALTIKKWLVEKGIPKERVIAVGFGESKPIADNSKEEGRAQNRRTEFKIAELKNKPYLGQDPTAGGKVFDL